MLQNVHPGQLFQFLREGIFFVSGVINVFSINLSVKWPLVLAVKRLFALVSVPTISLLPRCWAVESFPW